MEQIKNKIATTLYRLGISANFVSFLGLFIALVSGVLIYQGHRFWAVAAILSAGGLDLLDGAVARVSKKQHPFGGILDSSLDRYGDGFIFCGLLFFCFNAGRPFYAFLAAIAWIGSFSISYVRARAECVIPGCRVGFWERGERIVYIALGLLFNNISLVLWILALGTNLTAVFRIIYAYQMLISKEEISKKKAWKDFLFQKNGRNNPAYWVKAGLFLLLVAFIHLGF